MICVKKYTNLRVNICRDRGGYYVCVYDHKGRFLFMSLNRLDKFVFGDPCYQLGGSRWRDPSYLCLNNPRDFEIDLNAPRIDGCCVLAHCVCNGWVGE